MTTEGTSKKRGRDKMDMIHGALTQKIIVFSLPLIASGILQQSFNAIDVAVIGHYSTNTAIAAVGSNGPIISILLNLFIGIAVGANVVIAQYIGERNFLRIRDAVSTVVIISIISGLILLLAGVLLAHPILQAMSAPPDVIDGATTYLRIFFCGTPFMMVYNFGGSILRSIGDTSKLFYSLLIATVCNLILDILFVAGFQWGVEGAAWATVISNGINALILTYYLHREEEPYKVRFNLHLWKFSTEDLRKMLSIGVPAGLQGMIFSISNIFIQSAINKFGANAIAGSAAALTYESYCYYIIAGLCGATIAFTSQNFGAKEYIRCKKVWLICMSLSVVTCLSCNLILVWQRDFFLGFFTTSPQVLQFASTRFTTVLLLQCLASSYEISGAYMRGLGYSFTPMILTIFGTCVLRLLWVGIFPQIDYSFHTLLEIYPITWIITGSMVITAAFIVQKRVFHKDLAK